MTAVRFRRTLMTRLAPVLVAAAAAALLLAAAVNGSLVLGAWSLAMGAALIAGLVGTVLALGDEVVVDGVGVRLGNRLLGRSRSVRWEDIARVQPGGRGGRNRTIFLVLVSGRRLVLDSLQDMDRLQTLLQDGSRCSPETVL